MLTLHMVSCGSLAHISLQDSVLKYPFKLGCRHQSGGTHLL